MKPRVVPAAQRSRMDNRKTEKPIDKNRVLLAGILLMIGYGLCNNILGYFISPVTEELGCSVAAFNLYFTIMSVASFLVAPIYGRLFRKMDVMKMLMIGGMLGTACFVAYGTNKAIGGFYIVAAVQGVIQNGTTAMAVTVQINRTFGEKSGRAMGIAMSGTGICSMGMSMVLPTLIEKFGWRVGYDICGAAWAIVFILAMMLILPIENLTFTEPEPVKQPKKKKDYRRPEQEVHEPEGITYHDAIRRPVFYIFILSVLFLNVIMVFSQHMPAVFADKGLDTARVSLVMTIFSIALIACKIGLGQIFDKLGAVKATIISLGAYIIGFAAISAGGLVFCLIGSLFAALGIASSTVLIPLITRKIFGARDYAMIFSNVSMATTFGVAVGSPIWGAFYDHFQGYTQAMIGAPFILLILIAVFVLLMKQK